MVALVVTPAAAADLADEAALAERYAPVVRLVEQPEECGPGEPYEPIDVDLSLRRADRRAARAVGRRPTSSRSALGRRSRRPLRVPPRLPGPRPRPGLRLRALGAAAHEGTTRRSTPTSRPTPATRASSRCSTGSSTPSTTGTTCTRATGRRSSSSSTPTTPREALATRARLRRLQPARGRRASATGTTTSSRSSTARIRSCYPAAGSHANFFEEALFIGSSADAGRRLRRHARPARRAAPGRASRSRAIPPRRAAAFPWIAFEGRWGELQQAFYNGPTGPNLKGSWTEPIRVSEGWRDRSYAVPPAAPSGPAQPTSSAGRSRPARWLSSGCCRNPLPTLVAPRCAARARSSSRLSRTTWRPIAPCASRAAAAWGQILSASGRMYVRRPRLFLGDRLAAPPDHGADNRPLQALLLGGARLARCRRRGRGRRRARRARRGRDRHDPDLFGLALVQAATACALVEIDEGRRSARSGPTGWRDAESVRSSARLAIAVAGVGAPLDDDRVPAPGRDLARRALGSGRAGRGARKVARAVAGSAEARGSYVAAGSRSPRSSGSAPRSRLPAGPLVGALLILFTSAPLALLNVVAGHRLRARDAVRRADDVATCTSTRETRHELDAADEARELPAEIQL